MALYTKDDQESWDAFQKENPVSFSLFPPYTDEKHRDDVLRYRAAYIQRIIDNDGQVGNLAFLGNPYVVTKDRPQSGSGIVAGPYAPPPAAIITQEQQTSEPYLNQGAVSATGVPNPTSAPRSWILRVKEFFRRLFS